MILEMCVITERSLGYSKLVVKNSHAQMHVLKWSYFSLKIFFTGLRVLELALSFESNLTSRRVLELRFNPKMVVLCPSVFLYL